MIIRRFGHSKFGGVNVENQEIEVVENRGGLKETIRKIFEAVVPPEKFEKLVGPSEFSVMQQEYNQLTEEAINEESAALYAMVGQQLEEKDAKIDELTTANIALETALQEARAEAEEAKERAITAELQVEAVERGIRFAREQEEEKQREIERLQSIIVAKDAEIARLREERTAQIEPAPYKPSVQLQDRIADGQNRIKSALEIALEGRQFRGRISAEGTFPDPEPPALQFDPATIAEDDRIPAPEAPPAVTEDTFQDTETQQPVPENVAGPDVGDVPEETFEQEVRRRLEALEDRVFPRTEGAAA